MRRGNREISVVIPTFNSERTIEQLLLHLTSQSIPAETYEVIVVDDGSSDATINIVQQFKNIALICQDHGGPGKARMNGIAHAEGNYMMFLDSDIDIGPTLLEEHFTFLESNPTVCATGGSVVEAVEAALFSWQLVDHLSSWFNAHPKTRYENSPEYLPSLNFCVRKSVFTEYDLMWPDGEVHKGEDVLFCQKLRENGLQFRFLAHASVMHYDRTTFRQHMRHMYDWGYHAPFVRGEIAQLGYNFLFPNSTILLILTAPLIVFGYTFLIWKSWARSRVVAVTVSLPQIFAGRIAYLSGVFMGTRQKATRQNALGLHPHAID